MPDGRQDHIWVITIIEGTLGVHPAKNKSSVNTVYDVLSCWPVLLQQKSGLHHHPYNLQPWPVCPPGRTVGLSSHLQESQKRSHHYKEKPPNNHLTTWSLLILFVRHDLTPHPHTGLSSLYSQEWSWAIPYPPVCTSGHWYHRHIPSAPFKWYWGIKPGHCAWQASTLANELHPHRTLCWCLSQFIHRYVDASQSEGRNYRDKGLLACSHGHWEDRLSL